MPIARPMEKQESTLENNHATLETLSLDRILNIFSCIGIISLINYSSH